jgi:hypothetical protein
MTSSINPNNIDGTYPIAGQDNDSQGFRDNFTNIKNNFTFAYDELTDLQSKAVLKSALTGGSINNDMAYAQLISPQLLKSVETVNNLGTKTGSFTISWADAHFQYYTTSGNTTLAFSNWPTSAYYTKLRLQITTDTTNRTVTFPAAVSVGLSDIQGAAGQVVTLPTAGVYLFELTTLDNGSTITIQDLLRNYDIVTTGSSGTFTSLNVSGNVLATGLSVFGNATLGNVGTVSGQFHSVVGNITQTTSGGAVYINTTGNVLAASVSAGQINTTGNVLAASVTTGALVSNGNIIIADPIGAGSFSSNLTVKGTVEFKSQDQSNNASVNTSTKSLTLAPGGDQFLLININGNCSIGYNATITPGHQTTVHVKNSAGALAYVIVPNANTNTGNAFIGLATGITGTFVFTSYGTDDGNVFVTVSR